MDVSIVFQEIHRIRRKYIFARFLVRYQAIFSAIIVPHAGDRILPRFNLLFDREAVFPSYGFTGKRFALNSNLPGAYQGIGFVFSANKFRQLSPCLPPTKGHRQAASGAAQDHLDRLSVFCFLEVLMNLPIALASCL